MPKLRRNCFEKSLKVQDWEWRPLRQFDGDFRLMPISRVEF